MFSLGLCLNDPVKEKQWKWSIVIPYDAYQQQVPQKMAKKCCPIVIVCNSKNVLCSNDCFLEAVFNFILLTHIYTFHLISLI